MSIAKIQWENPTSRMPNRKETLKDLLDNPRYQHDVLRAIWKAHEKGNKTVTVALQDGRIVQFNFNLLKKRGVTLEKV